MLPKIINLSLQLVVKEVEALLKHYPQHPYQVAFSCPELRQKLIDHVLQQIPHYYAIVENIQDLPQDPRCLYASIAEQLQLECLICESIVNVFHKNQNAVNAYIYHSESIALRKKSIDQSDII